MKSFKDFYVKNSHLEIKELIEYYAVFNGFNYFYDSHVSIKESILNYILKEAVCIKQEFDFLDKSSKKALSYLAKGDRKIYSIYKNQDISQFLGREIYKKLFGKKIIKREKTREKPFKIYPKQKIKKEFRNYKIEDKVRFCNNFYRFWFTFIAPNEELLENYEYLKILKIIEDGFEKFISLEFEYLSEKLIAQIFGKSKSFGSFWTKNTEIDLLFLTKDNKKIAGEAKWKNHQVCKNILTGLKKKCQREKLEIDYFAFFAKSGFSKELNKIKDKNILLFELEDFKKLYM